MNDKCHKNVEANNKDDKKNKRQVSPRKKDKGGSRNRKHNSSSDVSDSDSDEDSLSEDSDIDNGSTWETSKEDMSLDDHTSSSFSNKSSSKKINWNLAKNWKSGLKPNF